MAIAGANTKGSGSRRRPRYTAKPFSRNQMASAALVKPSERRPWMKLLMAKGRIATPPSTASPTKVPSLRAKKLNPERCAPSVWRNPIGLPLEDGGDALPAGGADRDQAAAGAAPREL